MNQDQPKNVLNWIICPDCQGEYLEKTCSKCKNKNIYLWTKGFLTFIGKIFDRQELITVNFKKLFRLVTRFLLISFGLWGIICLSKLIVDSGWLSQWLELNLSQYLVWFKKIGLSKRELNFLFWSSLITDFYLIYSLERDQEKKWKISPLSTTKQFETTENWEEIKKVKGKYKLDVLQSLDSDSQVLLGKAWNIAKHSKTSQLAPIHLLAAGLDISEIILVINRLGLNKATLEEKVKKVLSKIITKGQKKARPIQYTIEVKKILLLSYRLAAEKKRQEISPLEILEALISFDNYPKEIFYDLEVGLNEIKNVCLWIKVYKDLVERQKHFTRRARFKPKGPINRAYTAIATPYLDTYSDDLTHLARRGYLPMCIDREKETKQILRSFESGYQNALLVGPPGVGKETIINGLARRMVAEDVPELLQDRRLVSLDLSRLIAGASQSGEIEQRVQMIFNEIIRSGNIILVIQDLHNMIGVQTTRGELDISEILAGFLKNKAFLAIATSLPDEYRRLIEGQALDGVFGKIDIEEPDKNTTIQILEANVAGIEAKEKVYFSYRSLEKVVELSTRYLAENYLPSKAINLLKETAILVRNQKGKNQIVQPDDIAKLVAEKTDIPVQKITAKESEKLLNLEDKIHQRLVNQAEAVKMVASALRRARAELRNTDKPIVNLLFLGPTGVGKTELAKTVAEVYFGDEDKIIRLDMSEYQEKNSINRLIGVPGSGQGGQLTESIRKNPSCLLLLDEIEKAHPDILNVFLQVLDDGRLTDAIGRTVNFTNAIIISTSNAGTAFIQEEIKKGTPVPKIQEVLVEEKLKSHFRPEFLNRFDGVIVFKPLGLEEIQQIARLMLKKLAKQLDKKGIALEVTDQAVIELAQKGFDPKFGARPLSRVIQTEVNNALAKFLLTGKLGRRDVVVLDKGGQIRIEKGQEI